MPIAYSSNHSNYVPATGSLSEVFAVQIACGNSCLREMDEPLVFFAARKEINYPYDGPCTRNLPPLHSLVCQDHWSAFERRALIALCFVCVDLFGGPSLATTCQCHERERVHYADCWTQTACWGGTRAGIRAESKDLFSAIPSSYLLALLAFGDVVGVNYIILRDCSPNWGIGRRWIYNCYVLKRTCCIGSVCYAAILTVGRIRGICMLFSGAGTFRIVRYCARFGGRHDFVYGGDEIVCSDALYYRAISIACTAEWVRPCCFVQLV